MNMHSLIDRSKHGLVNGVKDKVNRVILGPINDIIDENLSDISTTIGSFIIRSIRGKFQRSISFNIGTNYFDAWMEDALFLILSKYNNMKRMNRIELTNTGQEKDGSSLRYRLEQGVHNLKYRNYDILLVIQSNQLPSTRGRSSYQTKYTIITYNLSENFVKQFEYDMLNQRNQLFKINPDNPYLNIYKDLHEPDGFTYWVNTLAINKRRLSTVYLPDESKKKIIETVNGFFASKAKYQKHGISHNLKILLYGPGGTGKDTIAKMIASEWNRNLYYITGGKNGKYIPNAITDNSEDMHNPLLLISDIDKYPYLINDTNVDLNTDENEKKEERMANKIQYGNMINALDGIMSPDGRIIIMTTNHIEKFSNVFRRSGRIDLEMEIGYVTPHVFRKYVYDFYNKSLPNEIELKNKKLTIADMQMDVLIYKLSVDEFIKKYVK